VDGPSHLQNLADIRRDSSQAFLSREPGEENNPAKAGTLVAVVEHLRLRVPTGGREAWLQAESETWDPWLRRQKGFVDREVLWNSDREEGVLLIHWASHEDWKAIPAREVTAIQKTFEDVARRCLNLPETSDNPFPLIFAGEVPLS
jgi:uncharacterized protein (TIGR03792 family)